MLIYFGWIIMRYSSCALGIEPFLYQVFFVKLWREDRIFCLRLSRKIICNFVQDCLTGATVGFF